MSFVDYYPDGNDEGCGKLIDLDIIFWKVHGSIYLPKRAFHFCLKIEIHPVDMPWTQKRNSSHKLKIMSTGEATKWSAWYSHLGSQIIYRYIKPLHEKKKQDKNKKSIRESQKYTTIMSLEDESLVEETNDHDCFFKKMYWLISVNSDVWWFKRGGFNA